MGSSPDAESAVATPAEEKEKPSENNWTLRKVKVLISVVYGNFFLGSCYSLMAPIFPPEAEKKGASATAYGLVFGIYQLIMFLSAPVYGKFMPKLNPGFMMKSGMLVSGCCVIAFGLLDYAPYGYPFICLAFLIRIVDAFGAAAFLIASYTTLGCELPDMMGRAMAVTEAAFASGLAVGPAIGGFLYEVGGFPLPFFVIGSLLLTGVAANFILYRGDDKEIFPQTIKLRELLSDLDFLVDMLCISTCFAMIAFNEASLEPHIRRFQLTPTATGAVFLIAGIVDTVFSPILGYIAEKVSNAQYLTLVGTLLFTVCYLIVGPVPTLKFETNFWAVMVSQFLLGLGMACVIVCSFTHGMKHFIEKGYPDEVGTYSMTSGLIFSASCFGAFVGPSLGGIMIDKIGYIKTTAVVVGVTILVATICASRLLYVFFRKATKKLVNLSGM